MRIPNKKLFLHKKYMGLKIPVDEWFLCEYEKTLSPKEIELIENLEALEAKIQEQAELVKEMRMAIFMKLYRERKEQEENENTNKT